MKKALLALLLIPHLVQAQTATLQLDDVPLADLIKVVYGEIAKVPYVMTTAVSEAREPVSISMKGQTVEAVVRQTDELLTVYGFHVKKKAGIVWIEKRKANAEEILYYQPKHRSAKYLTEVLSSVAPTKQAVTGQHDGQNEQRPAVNADKPQQTRQNPENRQEKQPVTQEVDQLALLVPADNLPQLKKLLEQLDRPTGEVLLKAAVYEVGTTRQEASGLQLALSVAGISVGMGGAIRTGNYASFSATGIQAVFNALDADSRFKSLSRPQVRVRNGATAKFAVGQEVPVLGSQSLDRNGNAMQSVDYKQSGIILTAKPEIRLDVIELDLNQEMSNFVSTNTGVNNSPTLIKRSVNTRLSIQPGEVVVLAGLQGDKTDTNQDSLPFLGWITGRSMQREQTEILVFIEAEKI